MTVSSNASSLISQRFFKNLLPIPGQRKLGFGQFVPDFALRDVTYQRTVRLSNFRGKQPLVLAFTRIFTEAHYCPFCFPHILALNDAYNQFQQQGAELLLITSTDIRQSQIVAQDLGLRLPLLSDESCQRFRQYGTGQALGAPLPAQFVIDAQGRLRYSHLFSFLEHNASPERLLTELAAIAPQR